MVDSWICNGPRNVESLPSYCMPHSVRARSMLKIIEIRLTTFPDTRPCNSKFEPTPRSFGTTLWSPRDKEHTNGSMWWQRERSLAAMFSRNFSFQKYIFKFYDFKRAFTGKFSSYLAPIPVFNGSVSNSSPTHLEYIYGYIGSFLNFSSFYTYYSIYKIFSNLLAFFHPAIDIFEYPPT